MMNAQHRARWTLLCWLSAAIVASAVLSAWSSAQAQSNYPNKPIRLIIAFAAGGPTDIIGRVTAAKLSEVLGQQVYVENRAGASGNIGNETVARAAPDGYTILLGTNSNAVNESLFKSTNIKYGRELIAVTPIAESSTVLVVSPSLNVKSVAELIALAKAKPEEVFYATAGKGTATHLTAELFNMAAGVKMVPVHYKGGGETLKDLLAGQVKVMFSTIPPVLQLVKSGALVGLATTGKTRDPALSELPTMTEAGLSDFDTQLWFGLMAPANTPPDIIAKLHSATQQALASPDMQAKLAAQGFSRMQGTTADFDAYVRREVAKWAKVIPAVGTIE
jgi:tripartite-type tricarboxylate transporter receptor subunit TctC